MKTPLPADPDRPFPSASPAVTAAPEPRLTVRVCRSEGEAAGLAADVRDGLQQPQKTLPPKYFYDERGSRLFDAICDLPEYYLTRAEQALLEAAANDIVERTQPLDLVELGSGTARKTRTLLAALGRRRSAVRYIPVDVSESTLRRAARELLATHPWLRIHALAGDYEQDLVHLPDGRRRLVLFLGSTIGNLTPAATHRFLTHLRAHLAAGDYFLLGIDLVKDTAVLEAAYNDRAGVTAAFNLNVLRVVNRTLAAGFVLEHFEHLAFFNRAASQIEMHLRSRIAQAVPIRALDLTVRFRQGETIHTEISRKFTRAEIEAAMRASGYAPCRWYASVDDAFALALARCT